MTSHDGDAWAYYADLQNRSRNLTSLTSYWWGLEAGRAYLLDAIGANSVPADPNELKTTLARTIASAKRLHRSHAAALSYNRPIDAPTADDAGAEARIEVARILRLVSSSDGAMLIDVGLGYTDHEVAERRGSTPGAVRVRVSRTRLKLVA